jgi:hypothetical protein
LAERYRWAQYPRQQLLPRQAPPPFFKVPMAWEARGLLVLFGSLGVAVGVVGLLVAGFVLWAIITV